MWTKDLIIKNIKRRLPERLEVLFGFVIPASLLIDEAVKQEYFFHLNEISCIATHENLIMLSLGIYMLLGITITKFRGTRLLVKTITGGRNERKD